MIEEGESSGRDQIYKHTLNIINESPIFGAYYVIPYGLQQGSYPHNFFLEAFLATGVVGGVLYVCLVFYSIYKCYNLIKQDHGSSWILLLYLQMICFGMFSTGLYSSQDFWILLFFVFSINLTKRTQYNRIYNN
ncbi:MAG: O-antigen ligase family protein [Nitrosopumilus sp.]|nr:O-antigen ligase family protein [Nitrosopumilus sp.]